MSRALIENKEVVVTGKLFRMVRLRAEGYEFVDNPGQFMDKLRDGKIRADLFSFTQRIPDRTPKYPYRFEWDKFAVMPIDTYEKWWKDQINDKTRNMVRRAAKKGVVIRQVPLDDDLVKGIAGIHNESPLRQGKPFTHYNKPLETVKKDHISFVDKSDFIGAFLEGELIGFIKLVHQGEWSSMMQIISKVSHRDKAPTNALLAKAVEICAEKGVHQLQYGIWSSRGLGEFKIRHGFQPVAVPRYYVPLNLKGHLMLRGKLYRRPGDYVPGAIWDLLMNLRGKWYSYKFRNHKSDGAVAQLAEHRAKA